MTITNIKHEPSGYWRAAISNDVTKEKYHGTLEPTEQEAKVATKEHYLQDIQNKIDEHQDQINLLTSFKQAVEAL